MYDRPTKHSHSQEYTTLSDQRMLQQALMKGWELSDDVKRKAEAAINQILSLDKTRVCQESGYGGVDDKELLKLKLLAVKNLALLDSLNVKRFALLLPKNIVHHNAKDLSDEELDEAIKIYAEVVETERREAKVLEKEVA